jgi:hypothetical protein
MKARNRLPAIVDLDQVAKAWEAADPPARAQREHARALLALQTSRQKIAVAVQRENERRRRLLEEKLQRDLIDRPLAVARFVGSSIGGPAPGPHYSHRPGPGVPAPPGGRGTGGRGGPHPGAPRDYLLTDD